MLYRAVGSYENLGKRRTSISKEEQVLLLIELESGGEVLTPCPPGSAGPAVVVLAWFGESSKSRSILKVS